jgi:hypothetical protein
MIPIPPGFDSWSVCAHDAFIRISRISQSISFQRCSLSFREQGSGEPVVFIQGVG